MTFKNNEKIKDPWYAVCLSGVCPGLGQIYTGNILKGIIIFILIIGASYLGVWFFITPEVNALISYYLLIIILIIFILNLFDAYRSTQKKHLSIDLKKEKNLWYAIFLSFILPGLGHFYFRKMFWGLSFLGVSILSFVLKDKLSYLFFAIISIFITLSMIFHLYKYCLNRNNIAKREIVLLHIIITILLVILCVFNYIFDNNFELAKSRGHSMESTLTEGDYTLKKLYIDTKFKKGDIISFFDEDSEFSLGKRCIAVPGDKVEIRNNIVYVNDIKFNYYDFNENNSNVEFQKKHRYTYKPYTLPTNYYFVLGDNFFNSEDSREFGSIHISKIKGRLIKVIWPPSRMKKIE